VLAVARPQVYRMGGSLLQWARAAGPWRRRRSGCARVLCRSCFSAAQRGLPPWLTSPPSAPSAPLNPTHPPASPPTTLRRPLPQRSQA